MYVNLQNRARTPRFRGLGRLRQRRGLGDGWGDILNTGVGTSQINPMSELPPILTDPASTALADLQARLAQIRAGGVATQESPVAVSDIPYIQPIDTNWLMNFFAAGGNAGTTVPTTAAGALNSVGTWLNTPLFNLGTTPVTYGMAAAGATAIALLLAALVKRGRR